MKPSSNSDHGARTSLKRRRYCSSRRLPPLAPLVAEEEPEEEEAAPPWPADADRWWLPQAAAGSASLRDSMATRL